MEFSLKINGNEVEQLAVDEIRVTTQRKGVGKMVFKLLQRPDLRFQKGDIAVLIVDGVTMFRGRVTKSGRKKQRIIEVTCHDQILTLVRNKETYVYENKTAAEVVRMIAGDFGLNLGSIADTGFKIPFRVEDIQALLDIIYVAFDLTVINTGNLFVLYDDAGSLTLKNIRDMRINKLISSEETLIDFDYTEDISDSTYNKIKLVRDNEETGRRDVFIEMDSDNIRKWGRFQLHEKVSDNLTEGEVIRLAQRKLALHNKVKKQLKLKEKNADPRIRGGNSLLVQIPDLEDINLSHWLVVEKCVHIIKNSQHSMELDMAGNF
jgi:hypothetical protein